MLKHQYVASVKDKYPRLANLGSRIYAIIRARSNRRIVKNFSRLNFNGNIHDAVTGEIIPQNKVVELIQDGRVLVAKNMVNDLGLFNQFDKLFQDTYGVGVGELGSIHDSLSLEEILDGTESLKFNPELLSLVCTLSYSIFSSELELYAELMPNLRPHIPFQLVHGKEKFIEHRIGRGKINAHGPHKDSWRFHPQNTINIWLALSEVNSRNGMFVLPHSLDYWPRFANNEIVPGCDTYPQNQYLTELEFGDVLLFRAELVHGSVLNQTEVTRFAFTMRCTLDRPEFHKNFMYNYVRINKSFSNLIRQKILTKNDFSPLSRDTSSPRLGPQDRLLDKIASEDKDQLVVVLEDKEFRYCRRCPHQGVPLKYGWLEGDEIVCSQHQLRVRPVGSEDDRPTGRPKVK